MGDALREAYSDLFVIAAEPTNSDRSLIEGKFKSTHNCSERIAKLMASTFFSLLDIADIDQKTAKPKLAPKAETKVEPHHAAAPILPHTTAVAPPSLHYNIQIHLPATKDIEVFNAIFKSLREHLLE